MEIGLYGKLPSHGDFLRRRVADDFVSAWDEWLQQCIAHSRAALGEAWLETYLTSPAWRFALPAHVCGESAVAGVVVPSVDRVGRYFPLTIVWPSPIDFSTLEVAVHFRSAFEAAERLLLETLAAEQVEFSAFDRQVMELASQLEPPDAAPRLTASTLDAACASSVTALCLPVRGAEDLVAPAIQMLGRILDTRAGCCWWTDGSSAVEPCWLLTAALPEASRYCAMLSGGWSESGWQAGAVESTGEDAVSKPDIGPNHSIRVSSGAHSNPGSVRTTNQDAYLDRPDLRLWAVADGMGGMSEGDVASRMTCDALANVAMAVSLDEQLEHIGAQLSEVNGYLRRLATRAINPVESGSTVVVVTIRNFQFAALWAGDSRVYRLRDGILSQLTTDHSWNEAPTSEADEQAITRAIGVEDSLVPDIVRGEVQSGDRFLLCTDGLYRSMDVEAITSLLGGREPVPASKELVIQAIARGSTDNVTALVIHCADLQPAALIDALDIVSV